MSKPAVPTLAELLELEPWHRPVDLARRAYNQAEQAVVAWEKSTTNRHDLAPAALRLTVTARRLVLEAHLLVSDQDGREDLAYLTLLLDALASRQGFKPVERAAA